MSEESIFRGIALAVFVSAISIGVYHRIRAHRPDEKISRKEEGMPLLILLRLFGLAIWLGVIIYLVHPPWMGWSTFPLPSWLRWTGAGLGAACVPLIYWVFTSLGKNVTDTVVTRKGAILVTHGPYRWVRHPLYSVAALFFVAFTLLLANWFILLMVIPGFIGLAIRTPIEEAKLIEKFGDEYREYMKCTGRFIPLLLRSN
ncbi:isoprenylcysteine carboxylmethyltransferase family protein [Acidobacteria bacterium AH-259-L09]|nr:isoprenylcysteine carboxylmethyltransferase family protein [Acidobacteria bacterium AH-259-L09]